MTDASMGRLEHLLDRLGDSSPEWWIDDGSTRMAARQFVSDVRARAGEIRRQGGNERRPFIAGGTADFFIEMCATWLAGSVFCPLEPGLAEPAMQDVHALLGQRQTLTSMDHRVESTVLLTSGSTGARKGVRLTLASLLDNAEASVRRIGMSTADHLMINIPFHFTSAICHFLACLVAGARFTAIGQPLLARDLVDRVRRVAPTGFGGAPLQARWLVDGLEGACPLGWLMTSGDDLPASSREAASRKLPGVRLHVFYGLTEVAGRLTSLRPDDVPLFPGSVGMPIEGLAVDVLDEAGVIAAPGQIGEVYARGRMLMIGYVGQAEIPADGGRFATGDVGWKDERGFLYLAGRRDDVFKVSGSKVSGLAVREALLRTGMVADAFVVPVRMLGGLVVAGALVVPIAGKPLDLAALRAAARIAMETHALPREYIQVESVPRTGSGKPDRRAIDRLLQSQGWYRDQGGAVYSRGR